MKGYILSLTLALFAAASALAQKGGIEFRDGDAFVGPVRSARIETATFIRQEATLVEGPRRLSALVSCSPDGRRSVYEGYGEDGSLQQKIVAVYDDAGRVLERLIYDGRGELLKKFVYRPDAGEESIFAGDGTLLSRTVSVRSEGSLTEVGTYDGNGALLKRAVRERDGERTVWKTYAADGSLKEEAVARASAGGTILNENYSYGRDGSPAGRRVAKSSAGANDIEAVVEKPDGTPLRKTRETREYDSRRNLAKLVNFVWDDAAGDFVPFSVSYYTITYYR